MNAKSIAFFLFLPTFVGCFRIKHCRKVVMGSFSLSAIPNEKSKAQWADDESDETSNFADSTEVRRLDSSILAQLVRFP
jgi:hypothetical protein